MTKRCNLSEAVNVLMCLDSDMEQETPGVPGRVPRATICCRDSDECRSSRCGSVGARSREEVRERYAPRAKSSGARGRNRFDMNRQDEHGCRRPRLEPRRLHESQRSPKWRPSGPDQCRYPERGDRDRHRESIDNPCAVRTVGRRAGMRRSRAWLPDRVRRELRKQPPPSKP